MILTMATRIGLIIYLLAGVSLILLTPPLQVPDEDRHLLRAYQVSEGTLFPSLQDRFAGGQLPVALMEFENIYKPLIGQTANKTSLAQFKQAYNVRITEQREFMEFNNTALFPFISYLVPATGIAITRAITDRVYAGFTTGRFLNLLLSLLCLYLAIRIFPKGQAVFFFVALLPMNIFQAASLSSDAYTNAVCLLFAALAFRQMESGEIDRAALLRLTLAGLLVVSAKQLAAPLLGLVALIPLRNWPQFRSNIGAVLLFYLVVVPLMIFWVFKSKQSYMPLPWHPHAHAELQIDHIIDYPMDHFMVFVNDLHQRWLRHVQWAIGSRLGYLETVTPNWLVYGYMCLAGLIALFAKRTGHGILQAIGMLLIFILAVFVIELAIYINTAPIAAVFNDHVHGRYFLPYIVVLGAGLIALLRYKLPGALGDHILHLVLVYSAIGMVTTLLTIYNRYYVS